MRSTDRTVSIDGFSLPAAPPFPCTAWPTTPDARATAEREITERVNRRLAAEEVDQRGAERLVDLETLGFFIGGSND